MNNRLDFSKLKTPKNEEGKLDFSDLSHPIVKNENPILEYLNKPIQKIKPNVPLGSEYSIINPEVAKESFESYAGAPGIKLIAPKILSVASKTVGGLKNIATSPFKNISSYEEAAQKASQEYESAEQSAIPAKPGIYGSPKSELENVENEIGKHINIEGNHGIRMSRSLSDRVKSIEDYWSNAYKDFENKISNSKFNMPEQAMDKLKYDKNQILEKLKKGSDPRKVISEMEEEQKNPFYDYILSKAPKSNNTNASDFLSHYKDFRDSLSGIKNDLKSDKYGSIEKKQISDAIKKSKPMESQIKEVLDEGLGEFKPEFDWLNKGYSEQVYPLRGNPLVKKSKVGKLSSDVFSSLSTNESGMNVVRDIFKNDPELLRNLIGQKYLSKPGSIHNPNELIREFLDEMPEFKELLQKKENTLKEAIKRKDLSLESKVKAENELNKITKERKKNRTILGTSAATAATVLGIPIGVKLLGKVFGSGYQNQGEQ